MRHRRSTVAGSPGEEVLSVADTIPSYIEPFVFTGHEDLLRGTSLASIMRQQAAAFDMGSDAHELSEPVQMIDYFISHNWSVPRMWKFLALSFHFNSTRALLVAIFSTGVAVLLWLWGNPAGPSFPYLPVLVPIPVFWLTIWVHGDVRHALGLSTPTVFLDKTCINQVDPECKRQAIDKLGAFIAYSSEIIVLFSPDYLGRLWTIYELACFLAMKSAVGVTIIPVELPCVIFWCLLVIWVEEFILIATLRFETAGFGRALWEFGMLYLTQFVVAVIFHRHAYAKSDIFDRLHLFDVRSCACADESDRPMVHANIAVLMDLIGVMPTRSENDGEVPLEEALDAFNRLVQNELPELLVLRCDWMGMNYLGALKLSALIAAPALLLGMHEGWGAAYLFPALMVFPCSFRFLAFWVGMQAKLTGCLGVLFVASGALILVGMQGLAFFLQQNIFRKEFSSWWLLVWAAPVLCCLACWQNLRLLQRNRRTWTPSHELSGASASV